LNESLHLIDRLITPVGLAIELDAAQKALVAGKHRVDGFEFGWI